MRSRLWPATLAALLAAGASTAGAQEGPADLEFRARAQVGAYDNFFRVADPSQARTVRPWSADGRLTLRRDGSLLAQVYAEAAYTRYGPLGKSVGGGAGLRLAGGRHDFWLHARYFDDRPVFSVGDVVRAADIFWAGADYTYSLSPSWEAGLEGQTVRVRFDSLPGNRSSSYRVGGKIRYRALGGTVSPEAGGGIGWQRAENAGQADVRAHFYFRLLTVPTPRLRATVRFRYRARNYTTAVSESSNFGRLDEGGEWTLVAALRATRHLGFELHYQRLYMNSTARDRIFSTRTVTLGMALRF